MNLFSLALPALVFGAPTMIQPVTIGPPPVVAPAPTNPPPNTDDAYEGRAAPATSAGTSSFADGHVHPGLELFAQYAYRLTYAGSTTWNHDFDLPRAHGSIDGNFDIVHARLLIEAVRSTPEGALYGIDGDSFVFRVREAYADVTPISYVTARAGIVPTFSIPELDGTWMMRAISPSMLESSALASPADLGAQAIANLPKKYGWIGLGAYNGEGYNEQELNRGKNVEIAASIHPLPNSDALRPIAIHLEYTSGSEGTESARADRFNAALLYQGKMVRGGFAFTYAWGVGTDGSQQGAIGDAFIKIEPVDKFLIAARAAIFQRNVDARDSIFVANMAFGYRVAKPLEVYLAADRSLPTAIVRDAEPGSDYLQFRAVTRVVF